MTKPTGADEAPTEVTKPDNTVTDITPHMENGSDGRNTGMKTVSSRGTEGETERNLRQAARCVVLNRAVQGSAVATDKDVNIPDGTEAANGYATRR